MNKNIILIVSFVATSALAETDLGSKSETTIGELFKINQGKNPTQIADTEARARKAANELGLDYDKMTKPSEQPSSAVMEADKQKIVNEVIASDPVLGKYALDPKIKEEIVEKKIGYLNYFLIAISILAIFLSGFFFGRIKVKTK
nr:hypothetical protein [Acinetobacter soli]